MSDSPNIDPDLTTSAPDDDAPEHSKKEGPGAEVASPHEVDPNDGTDSKGNPVDNPAG